MSSTSDDFLKLTHGNYHAWAPQMTAELQRLGVWCFCTGSESIPMAKPVTTDLPADVSITLKLTAERNLSEATMMLADGMIKLLEQLWQKLNHLNTLALKTNWLKRFGMPYWHEMQTCTQA